MVASFCLILAIPLMLVIAVCVRATMGSPILFRQLRPGLRGQPFVLYKFRSMSPAYESESCADEHRISRLGGFLRSSSLDEHYLHRYSPEQQRRHEVLPGITGWAQVNGRNAIDWEERFALDLWYVDHRSLWLDLKILCLTLLRVLRRDGINRSGHVTTPEFMGQVENGNSQP